MEKILQFSSIALGAIGIADSALVLMVSNLNLGTALPGAAGVCLIVYGIYIHSVNTFLDSHWPLKLFIIVSAAVFLISFIICSIALWTSSSKKPAPGADAIIALGAGLNGENVSRTLAYRLEAAHGYATANPDCIVVVSGGQGPNEAVTEASAMKKYLIGLGIDEQRIIEEDKSTSTMENFQFSKSLLDARLPSADYRIVYVTNGFHTLRAGLIAEQCGLDAEGLSAESYPWLLPNFYIREYFSIIKYFTIDRNASI